MFNFISNLLTKSSPLINNKNTLYNHLLIENILLPTISSMSTQRRNYFGML